MFSTALPVVITMRGVAGIRLKSDDDHPMMWCGRFLCRARHSVVYPAAIRMDERWTTTGSVPDLSDKKIFMELLKSLRYRTEAPLMDCSTALKEANGNMEAAMKILKQKGQARAMKKHGRETLQGFVVCCVVHGLLPSLQLSHPSSSSSGSSIPTTLASLTTPGTEEKGSASGTALPFSAAAIITICAETDFACRNHHFQRLCVTVEQRLAQLVMASNGAVLADASTATTALQEATHEEVQAVAGVLGENVVVREVVPLHHPLSCSTTPKKVVLSDTSAMATTATGSSTGIPHAYRPIGIGAYTHGSVGEEKVGRVIGLVALASTVSGGGSPPSSPTMTMTEEGRKGEYVPCVPETIGSGLPMNIKKEVLDAVARHLVATSGEIDVEEEDDDDEERKEKQKKEEGQEIDANDRADPKGCLGGSDGTDVASRPCGMHKNNGSEEDRSVGEDGGPSASMKTKEEEEKKGRRNKDKKQNKKKKTKSAYQQVMEQTFFGAPVCSESGRAQTVNQWLKQHHVRLVKGVVLEFGKPPLVLEPPPPNRPGTA